MYVCYPYLYTCITGIIYVWYMIIRIGYVRPFGYMCMYILYTYTRKLQIHIIMSRLELEAPGDAMVSVHLHSLLRLEAR